MKNKGKKIYFTIFTLFLAVTVMITSSITLAFLGDTAMQSSIVRLANAVEVDSSITITSQAMYVSPSQTVKVEAVATVTSPGDGQTTDGLLRAKLNLVTDAVSVNIAVVEKSKFNGQDVYWKYSDGYYYLVTEEDGDNLFTVVTTTEGVDVPMEISIIIPKELTNADGGQEYKVSVTFTTIQARIFNSTGVDLINNTIENTTEIFDYVEGV